MHRIDAPGSILGKFDAGNPATGQQATMLTQDWFNDVQENLCYFIEQANIALVKGEESQLYDAFVQLVSGIVGAGGGAVPTTRLISPAGLVTGGGDLAADRTLTVTAATPAEAQAGLLNTVALTPYSVAGSGRVLSTVLNLPLLGGGIIKAGATTISGNSSKTISFPVAFPSDCVFADVAGGVVSTNAQDNNPVATSWSAGAFTAFNAVDSDQVIRWFAVGY